MTLSQMTQDELKALVGRAALDYVVPGEIVGVGTGSTVNHFLDALAGMKHRIAGAISSSDATTQRLQALGIKVYDGNAVGQIPVYVDGADEIDPQGCMIKGGGAALTREKIVAAQAEIFVCIADESKSVPVLGNFPLPVEVLAMAEQRIMREFTHLGGQAKIRSKNGEALVTDNGQHIIDVHGLRIDEPLTFEMQTSQWPGVVTVGVFACQKAHVCLLGSSRGVQAIRYENLTR